MCRLLQRSATSAIIFALIVLLAKGTKAYAEKLEPRSYSAAPIGTNFLFLGFANTSGAVSLDPTLPVSDVHGNFNAGDLGYEHTLLSARIWRAYPL